VFGSVRDDAASRRANIRLVEARNSRLVWAQLLDFSSAESGAENPAVQIAHQLLLAESRRPMPANPGAGHHVLLGRARLDGEQDAKANKDAQELFEKAYALDGNSIQALLGLAQPLVSDVLNGWVTPDQRPAALERAEAALRHVIAPDPRNVRGHFCSWRACAGAPDSDQAVAAYEHTLDLNRNFPHAHAALGRGKRLNPLYRTGPSVGPTDPAAWTCAIGREWLPSTRRTTKWRFAGFSSPAKPIVHMTPRLFLVGAGCGE
jgi:tetratricopeptide (TPR) repeat protein